MAKPPVSRTIDGVEFEFYPMSPKLSLRVLTRLTKVLGEPFALVGDLISGLKPEKPDAAATGGELGASGGGLRSLFDAKLPPEAFAKVARAFVTKLDEAEVVQTVEEVLGSVHGKMPGAAGTRRLMLETDFAGEAGLMLKVFAAALEVNFSSFFADGLAGVAGLRG